MTTGIRNSRKPRLAQQKTAQGLLKGVVPGQLLTRSQLAQRWQYSRETLKRKERSGTLPFLKIGSVVRYRLTQIEEIEKQSEVVS